MARIMAVLLVICLTFCVWSAVAEEEETYPFSSVQSILELDHQPFVFSGEGIYQYTDSKWIKVSSINAVQAASDGNAVYTITGLVSAADEGMTGRIVRYPYTGTFGEGEELGQFVIPGDIMYLSFHSVKTDGKTLWIMAQGDADEWDTYTIYAVNLETMDVRSLAKGKYNAMALGNGKLLVVEWDMAKAYENFSGDEADLLKPALMEMDSETGTTTTIGELPTSGCGGLAYDASENAVLIADVTKLYRIEDGTAVLCSYLLPSTDRRYSSAIAIDGHYTISSQITNIEVQTVSTNPEDMPSKLLIFAGSYLNQTVRDFAKAHPEIAVIASGTNAWTTEDITKQMMSGSESADIFQVSLSDNTFQALAKKGYAVELGQNAVISRTLDEMYPQYTEALKLSGGVYGFPESISNYSTVVAYNSYVWDEVGLTEDDLPRTYSEFIDLLLMWERELKDDYPEFSISELTNHFDRTLLQRIMITQMGECVRKGQPISFNTPAFREVLNKLTVLLPYLRAYNTEEYDWSYSETPTSLLTDFYNILPSQYDFSMYDDEINKTVPIPLTIEPGTEPVYPLSLSVYVINPSSQNAENAFTFFEYMCENMPEDTRIVLVPDYNEPMISPYYENEKKDIQNTLEMYRKQIEEAKTEEEKERYEENLADYQRYAESAEKRKYAITEEQIAAYRTIAPDCVILSNVSQFWGDETAPLINRFTEGQLNTDQFIAEFERVIRMITMEAE